MTFPNFCWYAFCFIFLLIVAEVVIRWVWFFFVVACVTAENMWGRLVTRRWRSVNEGEKRNARAGITRD